MLEVLQLLLVFLLQLEGIKLLLVMVLLDKLKDHGVAKMVKIHTLVVGLLLKSVQEAEAEAEETAETAAMMVVLVVVQIKVEMLVRHMLPGR